MKKRPPATRSCRFVERTLSFAPNYGWETMTKLLAFRETMPAIDIRHARSTIEPQIMKTPDLIPTRQSLLSRLKDWDDQESWQDFFNAYWRLIYQVALKARLNDTEAQEVVQETVISVAKEMPGFRYD